MPDDSVKVTIVADTAGAQASLKAAGTAAQDMRASFQGAAVDLSKASASFKALNPALFGVASAAATTSSGISAVKAAASGTAAGMDEVAHATTRAKTEFIVLGHEILTGRFSRIPGSLMVMAEGIRGMGSTFAELTPAMYAAGAAAAVFAGAIAAIAVSASRASAVMRAFQDAAAGTLFLPTTAALQRINTQLGVILPDASATARAALARVFAQVPGASEGLTGALAGFTAILSRKTGEDAEHAGKQVADEWAKGLKESPDPQAALQSLIQKFSNIQAQMPTTELGRSATVGQMARAHEQAAAIAQAWKDALTSIGNVPMSEVALENLNKYAEALKNTGATATEAAKETVRFWEQQLQTAEQNGGDVNGVMAKLDEARAQMARVSGEQAITTARDSTSAIAANENLSAAQRLAQESNVWRQLLAGDKLTADQRLEVQRDLNQSIVQMNREQEAAAKETADQQTRNGTEAYRQEMALIKSSDDEVMAAIKAAHAANRREELLAEQTEWQRRVQIAVQGSQQQIAAERGLAAVNVQIANEQAAVWRKAETEFTSAFTHPVNQAFDTMVSGMFNRTQSWSQTTKKAFDQMAQGFIENTAKMIAKWLAFQALTAMGSGGSAVAKALGMTGGPLQTLFGGIGGAAGGASSASTTAAIATQTATLTANTTAQTAALTASTTAQTAALSAAQTAALTASDTAQTAALAASVTAPIVAAIATETTTLGALLTLLNAKPSVLGTSYDSGTMSVPQDMMAMVHQGEMIIPADASAAIRGGSASIGGVATAGGANFNMGITAIDARSVTALFNNPTFTRMLTNLVARGSNLNPSLA